MTEKCPYCGKDCANTKALGSHIHYMHSNINLQEGRSEKDEQRFQHLFDSCLSEKNLPKIRGMEKIKKAITEIPEGLNPSLDKYRDAHKCALDKEKLLKEVEKLLGETDNEETR